MEFTPGGASRTPQTVIDLNGASTLNDFGFYDSGNYDMNAAMTHSNISVFGVTPLFLFHWTFQFYPPSKIPRLGNSYAPLAVPHSDFFNG
ncbi:unnamed protein product [Strongylus vulgaris]|uniref:Uncharacterized protein n=1 Tax=Strongylus vulgaris TaxID=40348 RepID=A0A3P7JBW0_STRVU|nr:unnamed protein product [Strongylus vulgaris]